MSEKKAGLHCDDISYSSMLTTNGFETSSGTYSTMSNDTLKSSVVQYLHSLVFLKRQY